MLAQFRKQALGTYRKCAIAGELTIGPHVAANAGSMRYERTAGHGYMSILNCQMRIRRKSGKIHDTHLRASHLLVAHGQLISIGAVMLAIELRVPGTLAHLSGARTSSVWSSTRICLCMLTTLACTRQIPKRAGATHPAHSSHAFAGQGCAGQHTAPRRGPRNALAHARSATGSMRVVTWQCHVTGQRARTHSSWCAFPRGAA
ncbi:hypothetical protein EV121DRAFT_274894 [Schizophyllum commune]